MNQHPIELILSRQLASYLAIPVFLVDPQGTLLFYNEPAEAILGRRFEETGKMPLEEWSVLYEPTDAEGERLEPDDLPLVQAIRHGRPDHRRFWIRGFDETSREIAATAIPLIGPSQRRVGALALFWEIDKA